MRRRSEEASEASADEAEPSSESEGPGEWLDGDSSERSTDDEAYDASFVTSDSAESSDASDCDESDVCDPACPPLALRWRRRVVVSDSEE